MPQKKRNGEVHLHYFLFADILVEVARSIGDSAPIDLLHREPLPAGARSLVAALERSPPTAAAG